MGILRLRYAEGSSPLMLILSHHADRLVHALLGTTLVDGTKAVELARPDRHKNEVFIVTAGG